MWWLDARLKPRIAVTSPGGRREEYGYSAGHANPCFNHNLESIRRPREVETGGPYYLFNEYRYDQTAPDSDRVVGQTIFGRGEVDDAGLVGHADQRAAHGKAGGLVGH